MIFMNELFFYFGNPVRLLYVWEFLQYTEAVRMANTVVVYSGYSFIRAT